MRTWNGLFEIQAILCSQRDRQFHFDDQQSNQIAQVFSNYLIYPITRPKKVGSFKRKQTNTFFSNIVPEDLEKRLAYEYLGFYQKSRPEL